MNHSKRCYYKRIIKLRISSGCQNMAIYCALYKACSFVPLPFLMADPPFLKPFVLA